MGQDQTVSSLHLVSTFIEDPHPSYGEGSLLADNQDRKFFRKEVLTDGSEASRQVLQQLQVLEQCPHVVRAVLNARQEDRSLCSHMAKMAVLYDYHPCSLEDELQARQSLQMPLPAKELVYVLHCVTFALERLQQQGVAVVQVTARDVLFGRDRHYKLFCPADTAIDSHTRTELLRLHSGLAYPPELLQYLGKGGVLPPERKAEGCMYSLAMLVARAAGCIPQQLEDQTLHARHAIHLKQAVLTSYPTLSELFDQILSREITSFGELLDRLARFCPAAGELPPALALKLFGAQVRSSHSIELKRQYHNEEDLKLPKKRLSLANLASPAQGRQSALLTPGRSQMLEAIDRMRAQRQAVLDLEFVCALDCGPP